LTASYENNVDRAEQSLTGACCPQARELFRRCRPAVFGGGRRWFDAMTNMRINNTQRRRQPAAAAAVLTDRRTDGRTDGQRSGGLFAGRNYSNISSTSDCTNRGRRSLLIIVVLIIVAVKLNGQ